MSINDLLDMDLIPIICIIIAIFICLLPIVIMIQEKSKDDILGYNDSEKEIKKLKVKIVEKKDQSMTIKGFIPIKMVMFESEKGERMELAIEDTDVFRMMVVGDRGLLSHQGRRFISFERDL